MSWRFTTAAITERLPQTAKACDEAWSRGPLLQPVAVLFQIPEDNIAVVRALLRNGANVPVEAWNRDRSIRLATGLLTAVDNQIDQATGTAKLKAIFDNRDDSLFPLCACKGQE
jgi:multidrug efflux pump subunit AcrA (membrane-fusion protein)